MTIGECFYSDNCQHPNCACTRPTEKRRPSETAWLVEINEPVSGPIYYQMEDDNDWTVDHDRALRFARREDAQKIIDYYGWTRATAVEHMWLGGSPLSSHHGKAGAT